MADDSSDSERHRESLPAAILNTKAGEKLMDAVKGVVGLGHNIADYVVGPKRIKNVAQARADAALIAAHAECEIDEIRARAADRLLDRERRNQQNIDAITKEALKALPPPETTISDEPVGEDFIYTFFDECQSIGNEQMQQIWGKLLAGEVVRPGTFHPRTLRILKDMRPDDARLFETLCRFIMRFSDDQVEDDRKLIVFETDDQIFKKNGLGFEGFGHLESLGLILIHSGDLGRKTPTGCVVRYGGRRIRLKVPPGLHAIPIGKVLLTGSGKELSTLSRTVVVPGFKDYVFKKWREAGVVTDFVTRRSRTTHKPP